MAEGIGKRLRPAPPGVAAPPPGVSGIGSVPPPATPTPVESSGPLAHGLARRARSLPSVESRPRLSAPVAGGGPDLGRVAASIPGLDRRSFDRLPPQPPMPAAAWAELLADAGVARAIDARSQRFAAAPRHARIAAMADVDRLLRRLGRPRGAPQHPGLRRFAQVERDQVLAAPVPADTGGLHGRWLSLLRLGFLEAPADRATARVVEQLGADLAPLSVADRLAVLEALPHDGPLGRLRDASQAQRDAARTELEAARLGAAGGQGDPLDRVPALLAALADGPRATREAARAALGAAVEDALSGPTPSSPDALVERWATIGEACQTARLDRDGAARLAFLDRAIAALPSSDDRWRALRRMSGQLQGTFAISQHIRAQLAVTPKPTRDAFAF